MIRFTYLTAAKPILLIFNSRNNLHSHLYLFTFRPHPLPIPTKISTAYLPNPFTKQCCLITTSSSLPSFRVLILVSNTDINPDENCMPKLLQRRKTAVDSQPSSTSITTRRARQSNATRRSSHGERRRAPRAYTPTSLAR